MFDHVYEPTGASFQAKKADVVVGGSPVFWVLKRAFDIGMSLLLLPFLSILAVLLLALNPRGNPGPLFYIQTRMGKDCRPFKAIKFRSMLSAAKILRGPEDPVESHRITRLGNILRRTRIDELPQILNVLKGDMSLIGPRPDYFEHACTYLATVPGYRERHSVRPGISGLAQVSVGYVSSTEGTRSKTQADLHYIRDAGLALDAKLFLRTIYTVLARAGS